jgi:hypothetical protein
MDIPRHFTGNLNFVQSIFSGVNPNVGLASYLKFRILRLDDAKAYDMTGGTFITPPATWSAWSTAEASVSALHANAGHLYVARHAILDGSGNPWARGSYKAMIRALTGVGSGVDGQVAEVDFTVGLFQDRHLAQSTVYDGTQLHLQLWVEEAGVFQNDYTQLTGLALTQVGGSQVAYVGTVNGSGGVFTPSAITVTLNAHTAYVLSATAVVPYAGSTNSGTLTFPLRVGLVRP